MSHITHIFSEFHLRITEFERLTLVKAQTLDFVDSSRLLLQNKVQAASCPGEATPYTHVLLYTVVISRRFR